MQPTGNKQAGFGGFAAHLATVRDANRRIVYHKNKAQVLLRKRILHLHTNHALGFYQLAKVASISIAVLNRFNRGSAALSEAEFKSTAHAVQAIESAVARGQVNLQSLAALREIVGCAGDGSAARITL